jgi:hypothetical protein
MMFGHWRRKNNQRLIKSGVLPDVFFVDVLLFLHFLGIGAVSPATSHSHKQQQRQNLIFVTALRKNALHFLYFLLLSLVATHFHSEAEKILFIVIFKSGCLHMKLFTGLKICE